MLLALFGFCMAWAYDPPTWVWLVGCVLVMNDIYNFWKEV